MDINKLAQLAHELSQEKGWWDEPQRTPVECHMLMVSEIAEATEDVREGRPHFKIENGKPEGEAVELADAVLRIMDYFGHKGWDLEATLLAKHEYNKTHTYRHGNKKL